MLIANLNAISLQFEEPLSAFANSSMPLGSTLQWFILKRRRVVIKRIYKQAFINKRNPQWRRALNDDGREFVQPL